MNRINDNNLSRFNAFVAEIMEMGEAKGLALSVIDGKGTIQYSNFYGYRDADKKLPINEDTIFGIASITKSFTALGIMQLVQEGTVSLDDPVSKYIPEYKGVHHGESVKIWHLLCHSGGYFPMWRHNIDPVLKDMGYSEDEQGDAALNLEVAEEGARLVSASLDAEKSFVGRPGERASYCNDGFALLGEVIRRAGDCRSYPEYLEKHVFAPLGMTRSSSDFVAPAKDPNTSVLYSKNEDGSLRADFDFHNLAFVLNAGGSVKSTLSDMSKYAAMYLNCGTSISGTRILDAFYTREMFKPRQAFGPFTWYCFGLEYFERLNAIGHGGSLPGVSSQMLFSADSDVAIIVLCNTENVSASLVAEAALRMYEGKDPIPEKHQYFEYEWDDEYKKAVAGDYVMAEGEEFSLYLDDSGKLKLLREGEEKDVIQVAPKKLIVPGKYSDGFVEFFENAAPITMARFGSRIYPKV